MTHGRRPLVEGGSRKEEGNTLPAPQGCSSPRFCEPMLHTPMQTAAGRAREAQENRYPRLRPCPAELAMGRLVQEQASISGGPAPELPQTLYPPAPSPWRQGTVIMCDSDPTFMTKGASHSLSRRACSSVAKPLGKPLGFPRHTPGR